MGFFAKLVGNKVADVQNAKKRFEKRDLMEACVAVAVAVAHADGELEDAELKQLTGIIETNPSFENFQSEIGSIVDKFVNMYKGSGQFIGLQKTMKEIRDIKNNSEEAEEAFLVGITIAMADGTLEKSEVAVLKQIGKELGLNLDNYIDSSAAT